MTFSVEQYELLDFGQGRRLERFGPLVLDRLCPSAEGLPKHNLAIWDKADAVFVSADSKKDAGRGVWKPKTDQGRRFFDPQTSKNSQNSEPWTILHNQIAFELRGTPFGHVGLFPEQAPNWGRITNLCRQFDCTAKVLNLFAYTGGSTLAAASSDVEVVHVDSARNIVQWGKRNAECSGLQNTKIRWLDEDARKFVKRERKRENSYQGIILDPPSYGHGTKGEVWRLSKHLEPLLVDCFSMLSPQNGCFLLLTCHTPGYTLKRLTEMVEKSAKNHFLNRFPSPNSYFLEKQTLTLHGKHGGELRLGESVLFCYNCRYTAERQ